MAPSWGLGSARSMHDDSTDGVIGVREMLKGRRSPTYMSPSTAAAALAAHQRHADGASAVCDKRKTSL